MATLMDTRKETGWLLFDECDAAMEMDGSHFPARPVALSYSLYEDALSSA